MGDDVGLRRALETSEKQAEPADPIPEQDPVVVAGVEFIKFVNQDRTRRLACIGPPDPPKILDLKHVFPSGDVNK